MDNARCALSWLVNALPQIWRECIHRKRLHAAQAQRGVASCCNGYYRDESYRSEPRASHPFHDWNVPAELCSGSSSSAITRYREAFCPNLNLVSSHRGYSHRTSRPLIRSPTKSGACYRDKFTVPGSTLSSTLSSVLSKSGFTSTTESSSKLFDSIVFDCVLVVVKTTVTLHNVSWARCSYVNNFPILKT